MDWNEMIEQLRPLGAKLRERLPPRLQDDPHTLAEAQRLLLAATMRGIADVIVSDPAHPIFVPELNIALNIFQPNSDTIYKCAVIGMGGRYRLRGERGGIRLMRMAQLGPDPLITGQLGAALGQHDFDELTLDEDGRFDVLLSEAKPEGHAGDWWPLHPKAEKLMIRFVSCDWGVERDPRLSLDRLDTPPTRPRLTKEALEARFAQLPVTAWWASNLLVRQVEKLRDEGFINTLKSVDFGQMVGLARQSYYEGAYDLAEDEALLIEVRVPKPCGYWSVILTNEIYETVDWYNNQASLNDAQAVPDSDGIYRLVVSARDPGVPNWLDTAGYARGAVQGRWLDVDEPPVPTTRHVKLAELSGLLPGDTPRVSAEQRDAALRERRHRAQMRTIW